MELHQSRSSGGFGPSPITHAEIAAWVSLRRLAVAVWEVRAIRRMDLAFMEEVQRVHAERAKQRA